MNLHENRCRQCKKLFCCVNCRLAHESKKHSKRELKCPLCCAKKLQITGKESQEFVCHLVFNHLPLLCRLCGKSFNSNRDLVILQKCGWWKTENSQRLLQVLGKSFPPTTPLEIKTFLNSYSNKESVTDSRHSSDFVTFNSPPVLTRNTSTPMHIGLNGPKSDLEFKSSNAWSFLLKTPRRISPSLEDKGSWPISDSSEIKRWNSDTQFYSRLYSQSRSSLQGSSLAQKSNNSSTNTTDYYSCDQLEADCNRRSILGTRVEDLSELEGQSKKQIKESTKRVRFSDHFEQLSEMAENDEFFEARENVSITSHRHKDNARRSDELGILTEEIPDVSANQENQLNVERENRVCVKENNDEVCLIKENKIPLNEDRFCEQKNQVCVEENNFPLEEDKENSLPNSQPGSMNSGLSGENPSMMEQSGSSRVVMMLLVENTSRFSRSELRPLIDSGLKKLEETAASMGSVYFPASSRSSPVERSISGNTESRTRRRSITSVNSYLSLTSTECFSAQSGSEWNSDESLSSGSVESSKSNGIFSVMARVVKSALRKLPGARLLEGETSQSTMQYSRTPRVSTSELPTLSFDSTSSLYSTLKNPSNKRPRDPTSPPAITKSSLEDESLEEKSPIAKRPRGWYKIRAREPIARMRKVEVTSPKGVSSETQRFQLGSLSVGKDNTILPLPSRAHQSTQTEQNRNRIN